MEVDKINYAFRIVKNFMGGFIFSLIFFFTLTCMAVNVDTGWEFQETLNDKMVTNIHYTGESVVKEQANNVVGGKSGIIAPPLYPPFKIICSDCGYIREIEWYDFISIITNPIAQVYRNNFGNCPQCGKRNWKTNVIVK